MKKSLQKTLTCEVLGYPVLLLEGMGQKCLLLSLKCKISAIRLVEKACIFLVLLIATIQIPMECKTQESKVGYTKPLNLNQTKT